MPPKSSAKGSRQKKTEMAKKTATAKQCEKPSSSGKENTKSQENAKENGNKYIHTTGAQCLAMVEWLEKASNYKIIVGESTAGKTVSHGAGVTKIEGSKRMAAYVHRSVVAAMCKTGVYDVALAEPWTGAVCRSRWKSYFARYKSTRDKLKNQTGFDVPAEMASLGITLEEMTNKLCPYYFRIDELFGEQSNVEPTSHTVEPDCEDGDDLWRSNDLDVSLPGNDEVFSSADEDLPGRGDQGPNSNEEMRSFQLPTNVSLVDLMPPVTSVATPASKDSSASRTVSSASIPSLPSRDKPDGYMSGDARSVDKANNAKRRDFASIYTEASDKRLQLSEKRMRQDLELKEKQLAQENQFRRDELKERERDRLQRPADKKAEEKNRMALQLLLSGKSLDEVNAILQTYFP